LYFANKIIIKTEKINNDKATQKYHITKKYIVYEGST